MKITFSVLVNITGFSMAGTDSNPEAKLDSFDFKVDGQSEISPEELITGNNNFFGFINRLEKDHKPEPKDEFTQRWFKVICPGHDDFGMTLKFSHYSEGDPDTLYLFVPKSEESESTTLPYNKSHLMEVPQP